MRVDLQPHLLADEAELVQPRGILRRLEQLCPALEAVKQPPELRRARQLEGRLVRRVVVVHRHLDGELPARPQRAREPAQQRGMVGHPVQRGVGESEIEGLRGRELRDVELLEAQPLRPRHLGEHRGGIVDAQRLARSELAVQLERHVARAAAEIDHAHPGPRLDQCEQIAEGLRPLGAEAIVLPGIPRVGHALRLAPGAKPSDLPRSRRPRRRAAAARAADRARLHRLRRARA